MLRSFAYAAETAAADIGSRLQETAPRAAAVGEEFRRHISQAFMTAYEEAAVESPIWIEDEATRQNVLKLHLLGKAFYEIAYEADNRPDWIGTPVRGVLAVLEQGDE